jgi:hypothetical protein
MSDDANSPAPATSRRHTKSDFGSGRRPAPFSVAIPEEIAEALIDRVEYGMQKGLLPINLQFLTRIMQCLFPEIYQRELPLPDEPIDTSPFTPEIAANWAERAKDRRCLWSPSDRFVPLHELAKSFQARVVG